MKDGERPHTLNPNHFLSDSEAVRSKGTGPRTLTSSLAALEMAHSSPNVLAFLPVLCRFRMGKDEPCKVARKK